jgi:hypothetical protein
MPGKEGEDGMVARDKEKRKLYNAHRYVQLKSQGTCISCGSAPARLNRSLCESCSDKAKASAMKIYLANREETMVRYRDRYHRLITSDLCTRCAAEPTVRSGRCTSCNTKYDAGVKARREKRVDAGVCLNCGIHLETSEFLTCLKCREKTRKKKK